MRDLHSHAEGEQEAQLSRHHSFYVFFLSLRWTERFDSCGRLNLPENVDLRGCEEMKDMV